MEEDPQDTANRASGRQVGEALRFWLLLVPLLNAPMWGALALQALQSEPARPMFGGTPEARPMKVLLLFGPWLVPGFFAVTLGRWSPLAGFLLGVLAYLAASVVSFLSIGCFGICPIVWTLVALCFLHRFLKDAKDVPGGSEVFLWAIYAAEVAGVLLLGVIFYFRG
jgi:hypothetical protein